MRDLKQYWREIRAIEGKLPENVWLVSLQNDLRDIRGGQMVEATPAVAAPLLHSKSHRLATEEEIAGLFAEQAEAQRREQADELLKSGVAVVPIPPK